MSNIILDGYNRLANAVLSGEARSPYDVPELITALEYLRIGKIERIVTSVLGKETTEVYYNSKISVLYNKSFTCENDDNSFTYVYYSERNFEKLEEDSLKAFELLTNLFCLCYSCTYTLEAQRLLNQVDRESGIPNKKGFNAFAKKLNKQGNISDYAVIRANIKGCNMLNNLFGYKATTDIIITYAKTLNSKMAEDEICSRQGSDNFILLVRKDRLKKHVKAFSGTKINFYLSNEKTSTRISLRAGIVMVEEDTTDINTILARAESCLDVARRKSDSDIVYYDKNTIKRELELTLLETEMPAALDNNEFIVYYQPKVKVDTRTLVGAEALIRWNKNGKLISPADFIPIAEHTGFIRHLDMFVLEYTCHMMKRWKKEGKTIVPVSVNFSKMHLRFPHLAEKIMRVINKYDIDPSYIEVEFTETAYTDDFNAIKQAIDDLKSYGVVVSMDDFGTGYSSLALLKDLDFDVLKVDKSLTGDKDNRGLVVLESVIRMAQDLSMTTICEGVEDKAIVDSLSEMGCNIIQGYYFDRPLPESEFAERLSNPVYTK